MHLTPIICVLHALIISYHLCFLPNIVHAIETHNIRAACPKNVPLFTPSTQFLHAFDTQTMRSACPSNILSSIFFCLTFYMHFTPTIAVLHALIISYHLCIVPKILHTFETRSRIVFLTSFSLSLLVRKPPLVVLGLLLIHEEFFRF